MTSECRVSPTDILKAIDETSGCTHVYFNQCYYKFAPEIYYKFLGDIVIKENEVNCRKQLFIFATREDAIRCAKLIVEQKPGKKIFATIPIN